MVDRQVWIHRQSVSQCVCVCVLNNELTFTRFYIRARAFSKKKGSKKREVRQRVEEWDIIPPRTPSRGGWLNNHWLAMNEGRKRRVSPQCRHIPLSSSGTEQKEERWCVCVRVRVALEIYS